MLSVCNGCELMDWLCLSCQESSRASLSKLGQKLETVPLNIRSICEPFTNNLWESLKESKMTAPLNKVSVLHGEALNCGNKEVASATERLSRASLVPHIL